jgi:hypothetical protein
MRDGQDWGLDMHDMHNFEFSVRIWIHNSEKRACSSGHGLKSSSILSADGNHAQRETAVDFSV